MAAAVHDSPAIATSEAPLIVHVIHHLIIGGLENGLVNLINRIPAERFRHAIVCMTDYNDFCLRIKRQDVRIFAMHKRPGHDYGLYRKLYRLFRRIKPALVHSRNLTALDSLLPATLARVPCKIHGEHGRDMSDVDGRNARHQWLRRIHSPLVSHYVALSKDLDRYLQNDIGVPERKITQIYNGVDTELFHPAVNGRESLPWSDDEDAQRFVIGTVGRMQEVKDQMTLARAFVILMRRAPGAADHLRLAMIGAGPLLDPVRTVLADAGLAQYAWLPGARDDVPRIMRAMDLFVLPSLAEGISNTILEAMATGLPVVATAVGGNPELIDAGHTGRLVPSADPEAMASALLDYYNDRQECRRQGRLARDRAQRLFSLNAMVDSYVSLYERMLRKGNASCVE